MQIYKIVIIITYMFFSVLVTPAIAQNEYKPRVVFIAADPMAGRPISIDGPLLVLNLEELPAVEAANEKVLAALLRSNPVSTFESSKVGASGSSSSLYIVTDISLSEQDGKATVKIGEESLPITEFTARLSALISKLGSSEKQVAFVRISDPEEKLPTALDDLRNVFDESGMAMTVLMVGREHKAACQEAPNSVEYAIVGGLADQEPFGNDDKQTTVAEASTWLSRALTRDVERGSFCSASYSLILRGDQPDDAIIAKHGPSPLFSEMHSEVFLERFEALFLRTSNELDPIGKYLEACRYCPYQEELTERLRNNADQMMALRLETDVWDDIKSDTKPERMTVYVNNCKLCTFKAEAEILINKLASEAEARDAENAAFEVLSETKNLNGLQEWRDNCIACDFAAEADSMISTMLQDERYLKEDNKINEALKANNGEMIATWLKSCEICAAKTVAENALKQIKFEAEAATTCIAEAGLPQQGGPRRLEDMAVAKARDACKALLVSFPDSPIAKTLLGRVDHAEGDIDAAIVAYEIGVAASLPSAFGLAAYAAFAPGDDAVSDYEKAHEFALKGFKRGDWLSGEVLTLLYLRDLVELKTPADAYPVASAHAAEGNPVAEFFLGYMYQTGTAIGKFPELAADWFEKSADKGYVRANSFLAELLETGADGLPADRELAADLYWKALIAGDETALERLTDQIENRPAAVVSVVQERLRKAGLFIGSIDGIAGPRTVSAIKNFAARQIEAQG